MARYNTFVTESGKVYKLRVGAICRVCGSDLSETNWAVGNGNICKTCYKDK